jgi:hypothetical protein
MMPDLPLFFPFGPSYYVTHDWLGALLIDLPIALVLFIIWRSLLRPAVPVVVPAWFRRRLPDEWFGDAAAGWRSVWTGGVRGVALLLASFAIGIASHILWDSFTHPNRWGSEVLPVIAQPWGPLDGTQWLQYVSSAFGLVVLAVWATRWLRRRPPVENDPVAPGWVAPAFWIAAAATLVLSGVIELAIHGIPDSEAFRYAAFRWGVPAGAAILIEALAAALIVAVTRRRQSRRVLES